MGSTMPFSKYTVESSLMEAMRAAFYRVCDVLQLSCDREDPLTEVVVTKIVELAKAGERDPGSSVQQGARGTRNIIRRRDPTRAAPAGIRLVIPDHASGS